MIKKLIAATTLALVSTVPVTVTAAHAGAEPASSAKARQCNVHSFKTRVDHVKGVTDVTLTRLASKVYAGRTHIKKGTYVSSQRSKTAYSSVHAKGGAKLGGSAVLKKLVTAFVKVDGSVEYYKKSSKTTSTNKRIYSSESITIPKATEVAWFKGYQSAHGTGRVTYCDAIEGRGDGFVKSYTAIWQTYATFSVEGAQRCDKHAYSAVARVAKGAVCNG